MQPIDDYLERSLCLPEAEFVASLPRGVLLAEPDAPAGEPATTPPKPTKLEVEERDEIPTWMRGARVTGNEVIFVLPLIKREGAALPDRILIGRTAENDLAIPHLTISRAHAYLTFDGERPVLVDTGSKHGTRIREQRLEPGKPYPLTTGVRIQFGSIRTMYLSASRFFQYCQARTIADHAQRTIDGAISYKP